jgi:hypothetical protein
MWMPRRTVLRALAASAAGLSGARGPASAQALPTDFGWEGNVVRPRPVREPMGSVSGIKARSLKEWGTVPSVRLLQRAIDETSAEASELWVPGEETISLSEPLFARPNLRLTISSGIRLERGWDAQNSSFGSGMLTIADWSSKVSDVRIRGGIWSSADARGRVIEFLGDGWTLEDIFVDGWGDRELGAMALLAVGDDLNVRRIAFARPAPSLGTDAVHIGGGSRILVDGVSGVAADDLVGVFPIVRPRGHKAALRLEHPIQDVTITNVFGTSTMARVVGLGLHHRTLSTSVQRIDISSVRGFAGGRAGVTVRNATRFGESVGSIRLRNLDISCSMHCDTGALRLEGAKDLHISDVRLSGFSGPGINLLRTDRVTVERFDIDASAGRSGIEAVSHLNNSLNIAEGAIISGSQSGIRLGAGFRNSATKVSIENVRFNTSPGARAIDIDHARDVIIKDCIFEMHGSTDPAPIRVGALSRSVEFGTRNKYLDPELPIPDPIELQPDAVGRAHHLD